MKQLILTLVLYVLVASSLRAQQVSNWVKVTDHAGWKPRDSQGEVVYQDKLWICGGWHGSLEAPPRDVWSSKDGVHWQQETAAAPWRPRVWFPAVVYRNRMWVLGGASNKPWTNQGDAWYSQDGKTWKKLKSDLIWKERHEHSAYVFQDKIWIAGGHARPLNSEVWSLKLPKDWPQNE